MWQLEVNQKNGEDKPWLPDEETYWFEGEAEDAQRNLEKAQANFLKATARFGQSMKEFASVFSKSGPRIRGDLALEDSIQQLPPSPPRTASVSESLGRKSGVLSTPYIPHPKTAKSRKRSFDDMLDSADTIDKIDTLAKKRRLDMEERKEQQITATVPSSCSKPPASHISDDASLKLSQSQAPNHHASSAGEYPLHSPPSVMETVEEGDTNLVKVAPISMEGQPSTSLAEPMGEDHPPPHLNFISQEDPRVTHFGPYQSYTAESQLVIEDSRRFVTESAASLADPVAKMVHNCDRDTTSDPPEIYLKNPGALRLASNRHTEALYTAKI